MPGAVLTLATLVLALAVAHLSLGGYLARVLTSDRHLAVERAVYRLSGVNPQSQQRWSTYAIACLALAVVSIALLTALVLLQGRLPLSSGESQSRTGALNTAVSFVTNTNWQSYGGETGASRLVQTLGLTIQNFVSAAVGIAVCAALIRGVARDGSGTVGNFWVDLTRVVVRVLLPVAAVGAVLLLAGGVIQNLDAPTTVGTLGGGQQQINGGLVASQEAIKLLGTNGGGYFNANSAHPFENPNAVTNLLEIFLILLIPFALPRTYGLMVGDRRQGWAVLGFMVTLWAAALTITTIAESRAATGPLGGMEGKEVRFGIFGSALFASSTTGTSTGAVNSMHESYSPIGGGTLLLNMLLGEVSPGGVGSGMYGAFLLATLTVFLAGLMVGRTPELLGKRIGRREITCTSLALITAPALVLLGTGLALVVPASRAAVADDGAHGLTTMLYAFASAANNNGSAYAGLSADQPVLNLALATCMLLGRYLPVVLVLALAGSLAAQRRSPVTASSMPTHTPLFSGLMVGVALLVAGLTFLPALALGPLAEALS
ncbi:potassium-transporting ATPase subunit KdpA [Barrientosiimonas endolithica]|uniref:Potassium-transporting ATPase potassium-binding subunit n=1 Tax=Barrientosiimonas endolithica TaxID=1535208 RepID=A0ABN6YJ43_9MICO|nr:potassium-transporting ATPase subunit KdpA [Barrientosiimonas endolithica]BDZ57492.1 potassium-transporting ATPase potassium-binding subunit [Barrientosiimonas endolithica]